ncbi:MAG: carbohydrate ABC transporter permease [Chloroflexi bacterium]|nr:carbohydrate ABC transporter permease [Chloroflexota bacterium]
MTEQVGTFPSDEQLGRSRITHGYVIFRRILGKTLAYAGLSAVLAITAIPFLWMVFGAFKTEIQLFEYPPSLWPNPWKNNFPLLFRAIPFGHMFFNSWEISILATLGALVSSAMAAYAFARLKFWGRDQLFIVMLATMMVPAQVTMVPVFIIMHRLGWIDTHLPLIVPNWVGWAFGIFLMRQFFLQISSEMEDAAKIDGANAFQIFIRIFVPLSKPVLATLAVFAFLYTWNDLLGPIIYLTTQEKMTLTVGIATFKGFQYNRFDLFMAGALISVVPILIIFVIAQKYFVRGITISGGLKG